MLATSLFVFSVLTNKTFYTYQPAQVSDAFICFTKNNDSWPLQWIRLETKIINGVPLFKFSRNNITDNIFLDYKLIYFYRNRSAVATTWKTAYDASTSICKTSSLPPITTDKKINKTVEHKAEGSETKLINCNIHPNIFLNIVISFSISCLILNKIINLYKLMIIIKDNK